MPMELRILRHGRTQANLLRQYCGRTDLPLLPEESETLRPLEPAADVVFVTSLQRTAQTAALLFPGVRQIVIPQLQEFDFGRFEGFTYEQLKHDPDYIRWISDETGIVACPNGESRSQFEARICAGFSALCAQLPEYSHPTLVTHGGTIATLMTQFCREERNFYQWQPTCGHGWTVEIDLHTREITAIAAI